MAAVDFPWAQRVAAGEAEAVRAIDDLPVWSGPFGEALMGEVRLRRGLRVLDVGCGLGYPLLELASRLGPTACCTGLDPWGPALDAARLKAQIRGLAMDLRQGEAEAMPFPDAAFDLVLSNNGLNNVADAERALAECRRVAAPGAQFLMTVNLPGTFQAFYGVFEEVLMAHGRGDRVGALRAHRLAKRQPAEVWVDRVLAAGFRVRSVRQHTFTWRLTDGQAILAHPALRLSFLPAWVEAAGGAELLPALEAALDRRAEAWGGFPLDVPFLLLDAEG